MAWCLKYRLHSQQYSTAGHESSYSSLHSAAFLPLYSTYAWSLPLSRSLSESNIKESFPLLPVIYVLHMDSMSFSGQSY